MPMESLRIDPQELLNFNLSKRTLTKEQRDKTRASSSLEEGFDMPMTLPNERRSTTNEMMEEDEGNEMLVETLGSLVIYDRS